MHFYLIFKSFLYKHHLNHLLSCLITSVTRFGQNLPFWEKPSEYWQIFRSELLYIYWIYFWKWFLKLWIGSRALLLREERERGGSDAKMGRNFKPLILMPNAWWQSQKIDPIWGIVRSCPLKDISLSLSLYLCLHFVTSQFLSTLVSLSYYIYISLFLFKRHLSLSLSLSLRLSSFCRFSLPFYLFLFVIIPTFLWFSFNASLFSLSFFLFLFYRFLTLAPSLVSLIFPN